MIKGIFRRFISLLAFAAITIPLYHFGISDINSQSLWEEKKALLSDLQNNPNRLSTEALVIQAQALSEASSDLSETLSTAAFRQNPSSGRAATHLLSIYESNGEVGKADGVAELASKLWPAHSYTRSTLAEYWVRRGRADKVVEEWNVLLTRGARGHDLFPVLKAMLEDSQYSNLILQFVENPPRWWDGFFTYLSLELDLQRLVLLYRLRLASGSAPSKSEQKNYVERLIKERQWQEANDIWFIGLKPSQMRYSGLLFDGGFESNVYNQGFGWNLSRSKNPRIKRDISYGIKGRKALQVTLRKQKPIDFKHVWQRILLEPGLYELSFRYRTDTLKTTKGLTWRIRCIDGEERTLVESIPLLGSNPWSSTSVRFEIPAGCGVQMLRLETVSPYRHDHFFQGSAWFDDMKINAAEAALEGQS